MTLVDLTYLQFNLIAVIDAGKHQGVTFDEVKRAIGSGDLFNWLKHRFIGHMDISIYEGDRASVAREINQALEDAADGVSGRERKKMGVENNGVCLLAALVTEVIQRRDWKDA